MTESNPLHTELAPSTPEAIGQMLRAKLFYTDYQSLTIKTPASLIDVNGNWGEDLHLWFELTKSRSLEIAVLGSGVDNGYDVVQPVAWFSTVEAEDATTDVSCLRTNQLGSHGGTNDQIIPKRPLELVGTASSKDLRDLGLIVNVLPDLSTAQDESSRW